MKNMSNTLRIATRKSPLALWQANFVKVALQTHFPNLQIELVEMTTKGDIILDTPLAKIGGKGLFVKELELALLENRADIAVHSMKDVPMYFPEGLGLVAICKREDYRDAFVSNDYHTLAQMPGGAIVGTSSLRRQCQIKAYYPHLIVKPLRGNVGSRLNKLDEGEYDAIILACAGLIRLGMEHRIQHFMPSDLLLPAVGQGAIGIESRLDDDRVLSYLAVLHDVETAYCVTAERAMNTHLQGGCQVPIAGLAVLSHHQLTLKALVGKIDGSQIIRAVQTADISQATELGIWVAEELLKNGADVILREVYNEE